MKYSVGVCISIFILLAFGTASYSAEINIIRDALTTKFSQSSKGIVTSVSSLKGYIQIGASKGDSGDAREIVIDVAVALNRINDKIGKWSKVSVTISKTVYSFSRMDFDIFRSGTISDSQFMKKVIKKRL